MDYILRYWTSLRNRVDRKGSAAMGMLASLLVAFLGHSLWLTALAALYFLVFAAAYAGPTQKEPKA